MFFFFPIDLLLKIMISSLLYNCLYLNSVIPLMNLIYILRYHYFHLLKTMNRK